MSEFYVYDWTAGQKGLRPNYVCVSMDSQKAQEARFPSLFRSVNGSEQQFRNPELYRGHLIVEQMVGGLPPSLEERQAGKKAKFLFTVYALIHYPSTNIQKTCVMVVNSRLKTRYDALLYVDLKMDEAKTYLDACKVWPVVPVTIMLTGPERQVLESAAAEAETTPSELIRTVNFRVLGAKYQCEADKKGKVD